MVPLVLVCVSGAGLVGCGPTTATGGSYPLLRTDERPLAISFLGVDGQQRLSTIRGGAGRVQLVLFDVEALATQRQLAVLRGVRDELNGSGLRLLRVTLDDGQLRSHDILYNGRPTADPRVSELSRRVHRLAVVGLSYTEIVDTQGRVAARLIGTSKPDRLQAALRRLLGAR